MVSSAGGEGGFMLNRAGLLDYKINGFVIFAECCELFCPESTVFNLVVFVNSRSFFA